MPAGADPFSDKQGEALGGTGQDKHPEQGRGGRASAEAGAGAPFTRIPEAAGHTANTPRSHDPVVRSSAIQTQKTCVLNEEKSLKYQR